MSAQTTRQHNPNTDSPWTANAWLLPKRRQPGRRQARKITQTVVEALSAGAILRTHKTSPQIGRRYVTAGPYRYADGAADFAYIDEGRHYHRQENSKSAYIIARAFIDAVGNDLAYDAAKQALAELADERRPAGRK